MLCCAVLCCAVLCCAVLCCAVLCCAVLCCAELCCAVLCCAELCYAVLCCTVLYCNMLSLSDTHGSIDHQSSLIFYFSSFVYFSIIHSSCHILFRTGTIGRFINHSCESNCCIEVWTFNSSLHVGIFTSKGALTYTYTHTYTHMHAYIHLLTHIHTHICTHKHAHAYSNSKRYVYVSMYTRTRTIIQYILCIPYLEIMRIVKSVSSTIESVVYCSQNYIYSSINTYHYYVVFSSSNIFSFLINHQCYDVIMFILQRSLQDLNYRLIINGQYHHEYPRNVSV